MQMRNFSTEVTIRRFWPEIRPDYFNNTTLLLNGEVVWPLEDGENPPVLPAKGVAFHLEIPSGCLEGTIYEVKPINDIIEEWWLVDCTWAGKYAGLAAGNSGICNFRVFPRPETMVKSSIDEEELTYSEYVAVRRLVEAACRGGTGQPIWPWPEENWELMRTALGYLRAVRQEAERMSANS